jgi:hypothetical protein
MTGIAFAILLVTIVASVSATGALCVALERHSQREMRRQRFGLAPLNFP